MKYVCFNYKNFLKAQRDLFLSCFPENKGKASTSEEYYFWKFHSLKSSVPSSFEYAAFKDNDLVGYYAALPFVYKISTQKLVCGMVCDVMTRPDFQGKGVFTGIGRFALADLKQKKIDFVSGYPIRPEVLPGHLKVGWSVAFELPLYIRSIQPSLILNKTKLKLFSSYVDFISTAYLKVTNHFKKNDNRYVAKISTPKEFFYTEEYKVFFSRWSQDVKNHVEKSADFLDWRLSTIGTDYKVLHVWNPEELVACAVVCLTTYRGITNVGLLDLMVLREEESALIKLQNEIELFSRKASAGLIACMMNPTAAKKVQLIKFGYIKSPIRFKLILNNLSNRVSSNELNNERDWHLSWIDTDDL